MHDDHSQPSELSPQRTDEIMERALLTEILVLHPTQLTILELATRMDGSEHFDRGDAVERAIRELTRDGLLRSDCRRIWPSRAALRFDELLSTDGAL